MICSKCKKNIAVVYIARMDGERHVNEGLCLKCAKDLGIGPVNQIMDKLGMSEEELESMSMELMQSMGGPDADHDDEPSGSTASFSFLNKLMGGGNGGDDAHLPARPSPGADPKKEEERAGNKNQKRKFLDNYCLNLTRSAAQGKLDRIVGREKELSRVIQILNRRSKNNPCLIGEPGVGKTAIAEALAQRIVENRVPVKLRDKEIYLVDLTALVAGTQFRGQFESRLKSLVEEVKAAGNIILFLDEVHNLVAAGDAEGAMNAANILKPALSRGEIQMVGATTLVEYRKHIEKDTALERRFQPVVINEPSIDDSIEILKGIKGYYEQFHGVVIDDEVVRQAVLLSERYITDRYLPDKAIDILDEACSDINLKNPDIIESQSLDLRLGEIEGKIESLLTSGRSDVYMQIADLRMEECRLKDRRNEIAARGGVKLGVDSLAHVIELWTDIPASRICQQEFMRLSSLEGRLKGRIVGQDDAVEAVCAAIKRNRVGISPKRKPVTMIFAGATGVGKTELVKTLASELFDTPDSLIRLDMSEFMEKHSVSRIIGAPPGYVGYDDAGQLTEKVRRKPYCVVLFDEIEKAHPDVLNILLQIMDDGSVRDAHGKLINFENAVIIMTTNAGSNIKGGSAGFQRSVGPMAKDKTLKALRDFLRPEFLNRVDEIIVFNPLGKEQFHSICRIMLGDLQKSLAEKDITLCFSDEAVSYIVSHSFDEEFGARSLRRYIQREIENKIANLLIDNFDSPVCAVSIDAKEEGLSFSSM